MATKTVELEGIGPVYLYKRRSAKHLRLSVTSTGKVRVTMPTWVPYSAGVAFARQKQTWLEAQAQPKLVLHDGMAIGKTHRLHFVSDPRAAKVTTRLQAGSINVKLPSGLSSANEIVQIAAVRACVRALKREAEDMLPQRLRQRAEQHGFTYRSAEIKLLRSRWGSCNHRQEIVLNCFLMQLPWELIDYVLMHELVHTRIMAHGPRFWAEMNKYVDNLPDIRQAMRQHRPTVQAVLGQQ